jgi:hypothetical protein
MGRSPNVDGEFGEVMMYKPKFGGTGEDRGRRIRGKLRQRLLQKVANSNEAITWD